MQELNKKKRKMMKNFEMLKKQVMLGEKKDEESMRIEEIVNESDWTSKRVSLSSFKQKQDANGRFH